MMVRMLAVVVGGCALFGFGWDSPHLKLAEPEVHPPGTEAVQHMPDEGSPRSAALVDAILGGTVPDFMRDYVPVRYQAMDASGRFRTVEVHVTPDYLSVGTDDDYVYAPLGLPGARRIARELDAVLPTPFLVDRIHASAQTRIEPRPIPPNPAMRTTGALLEHQAMVDPELPLRPAGVLVAGHKKDVVLSSRLAAMPDRVAIYGWHHLDGTAIQPLSLWHGKRYVDYSHGVRLVSRSMRIDGKRYDLAEVMGDELLAPLVSDEGPIPGRLLASFDQADVFADDDELPAEVMLASGGPMSLP